MAKLPQSPAASSAMATVSPPRRAPIVVRVCTAIYHFLASLKLAVLSLGALAATLGYATFFEKSYGTAAVQEWIYGSAWFSILLAFLFANILCAALIRFPWKKRQTGFVITHASLLTLLAGSFWAVRTSEEGQVAALEGEVKDELVRNDFPVVRVKQIDPRNPEETLREWELPFRPGAFGWGPGQPRPNGMLGAVASILHREDSAHPEDLLTRPNDPFQLVVKSHIPASVPAVKHEADPNGSPMALIRPKFRAPNMPQARDVFADEHERWFVTDRRLHKIVKSEGPAQFAFYHVDRPELVEEFLNPPEDAGNDGVARFRYVDKTGKPRGYDWKLDGQAGKTTTLPDSDLTVKFLDVVGFPAGEAGLGEMLGESTVPIAELEVSRDGKPPVKHFALANLPMFPNVIPTARAEGQPPPQPLVAVTYFLPPALDPKTGRFGLVEVLAGPDNKLVYRVFGRPDAGKTGGKIRAKGPVKLGEEIVAFGNNPNMPMTLLFDVDEYLPAGVEKPICEPVLLPPGQMGNGIPASLMTLTVTDPDDPSKGETKEFYLRRSASLDPVWKTVTFGGSGGQPPSAVYRLAYDVDRKPLGFELKLVDFQRGFDPGTEKASKFSSDVLLTDKAAGIREQPIHVAMNEPLTHKGYTFYQSSFIREEDPRTGRETGRVQSVFQVHKNPAWWLMYLGCLGVVAGALTQFVMRAGVFTDGGRRERQREARKAIKRAEAQGLPVTFEMRAAAEMPEPKATQADTL
jgi:ResB-like family